MRHFLVAVYAFVMAVSGVQAGHHENGDDKQGVVIGTVFSDEGTPYSLIAGDTGFFLNNEMNDFTAKPGVPNAFGLVQGKANQVEGGKRPLSSMSPSMLLDDNGDVFMVTGSPGGSTIISTTLESMINVLDFDMNMQQSVNAPRIHNQWLPDVTRVEAGYLTPETREALRAMGHSFNETDSWGADEAVLVDSATGKRHGANDRRRPAGLAAGF